MIGPLIRSPKREPRESAAPLGVRRRAKNLITDLWEYALVPLARWEHQTLVTENVTIRVQGLGAGFAGYRIVFLTDLHTSPLVPAWWLGRAMARAVELQPDLIALGGDFLDDDPHYIAGLADILRPLRAPDGVFGVLGNHDHYVGAQGVREELAEAGVVELLNSSVRIERGESALVVAGIGDMETDSIDFAGALAGAGDDPVICLSHDPDVFAYWPDQHRLDLMLAGHTHGGQAHLPFIGPPYVPSQFGRRYLRGLVREGTRQLYVSRGVGASGVPFRWGCPPELTLIELQPDPS